MEPRHGEVGKAAASVVGIPYGPHLEFQWLHSPFLIQLPAYVPGFNLAQPQIRLQPLWPFGK